MYAYISNMSVEKNKDKEGVTLLELLIGISVIATTTGILLKFLS